MTLQIACAGCRLGNHKLHVEWVKSPIPGMIGGGIQCRCPGDCAETPDPVIEFLVDTIRRGYGEDHIERGYN